MAIQTITSTSARPGTVVGLALTMMLGSLGVSLPYVAMPTLGDAFGVSIQAVQWVVTSYVLAVTTLVVGVGRLGDIFGPRRVLVAGLSVFILATGVCAAAPTFWVLLAGRAAQGAGAAALIALTLVIARQTTQKDNVGRVMGLLGTMSAIGTALGPSLGGVLTAGLGWRAIFLALVPLSTLSLALLLVSLPPPSPAPRSSAAFDGAGTLLLGVSVALYALAISGIAGGWSSAGLLMLVSLGIAGLVIVERQVEAPLVRLELLKDGKLVAGLTSNMLTSAVMMATLVVGPFYLSRGLGMDVTTVGVVVSVGPIVAAISGIPSGIIVDRFGSRRVLVVGLIQVLGGCLALAVLTRALGVAGYLAALALLTSGYQLFLAANNTAVMLTASEADRGVISGMLTLSRNLGLATGASLIGGVFAAIIDSPDAGDPDIVTQGMNITFAFAGALIMIALLVVIRGLPSAKDGPEEQLVQH